MHFIEKSLKFCTQENKGYDYNNFWKYSIDKFGDLSFYKKTIRAVRNVISTPERMDLTNWIIDWGILNKIITMDDWDLDG